LTLQDCDIIAELGQFIRAGQTAGA
jgi:hypothetical protein